MSGAKNAALPILAASLLLEARSEITNVPALTDVEVMLSVLRSLGVRAEREGDRLGIDTTAVHPGSASYENVRRMRAAMLVLAPMLARFGTASISRPGGCTIGSRPINEHLGALRSLGADVREEGGTVHATTSGLKGARISLGVPSVGATHTAIMASCAASGETEIVNCAMEPEVGDLIAFLRAAGATIEGEGTSQILVQGSTQWTPTQHALIPDRIEAGSYLIASAITGGRLEVIGARLEHLGSLIGSLERAGVSVFPTSRGLVAERLGELRAVDVSTDAYPGFPTDLQAQFMALMSVANGVSVIEEKVFENRLMHVAELQRLGACIRLSGQVATIEGISTLRGASVEATDLRASMGLVIAGLAAKGTTTLYGADHLDRGYVDLVRKLRRCGAHIDRTEGGRA